MRSGDAPCASSTLLVVDEDPTGRGAIMTHLADAGFTCVGAGDASDARSVLDDRCPAALVLNFPIPGWKSFVSYLRERSPTIPVILCPQADDVSAAIAVIDGTRWDVVAKPLEAALLTRVLRRAIANHAAAGIRPCAPPLLAERLAEKILDLTETASVGSGHLAALSHEILTPLNGIVGLTSVLSETDLSADQRECVTALSSCGDRLTTLIADLLILSRKQRPRPDEPTADHPASCSPVGRVLVVDDCAINRRVATHVLERKLGVVAVAAASGDDALAALARERFDLVLMDCHMPSLDGFETTRRIRRGEGGVIDPGVCIVALTANATEESRFRCFAAGMNAFLTKPLCLGHLRAVVRQARDLADGREVFSSGTGSSLCR